MTAAASDHCENLVREADKDRFLATLFAPATQRPALFALYAFDVEISRVRDLAREPMPGEIRLQWWREVVEGGRAEEARAHPVASALVKTIQRYRLPAPMLADFIDTHAFNLYDDPMPTLAHAEAYAEKTSSVLFEMAAKILRSDVSVKEAARHAGIADTFAFWLRAFPHHAARRQLFIPQDLMLGAGVNSEDVFAAVATPALGNALFEMRHHVLEHLVGASSHLSFAPAEVLPAFLPIFLLERQLIRMNRSDYNPFAPPEIPQWQRQWDLWRAARRPKSAMARWPDALR